jgi:hypothetical protein
MRRRKCRIRQEALPGTADLDQIVTVGAVAMQENNQLARSP